MKINWLQVALLFLRIARFILESRKGGAKAADNEALEKEAERVREALAAANAVEPVSDRDGLHNDPHARH